ncbi:DUF4434 domain-containing protein [Paenibacillus taiwanensis]|uniref:DUF4434 domain-containing protein n=1 Tax=Paenibacillus taiwanensis TaxID=401638 RepID=UPI00042692FF|nr:DUF4434 domain-containing protein [Paenibacillus taiwanensis]
MGRKGAARGSNKSNCILLVLLCAVLWGSTAMTTGAASGEKTIKPVWDAKSMGSFIQPNITHEWTAQDWMEELSILKEAGHRLVIIQWTGDSKKKETIYPTALDGFKQDTSYKGDPLEFALQAADELGLDVWLGLNENQDWYKYHADQQVWLHQLFTYGLAFVDELHNRYGGHSSLKGYYLTNEMENCSYQSRTSIRNLAAEFKRVVDHVHALPGNLKTSTAPALWPESWCAQSPAQNQKAWKQTWDGILQQVPLDYLIVQDGLGGGYRSKEATIQWYAFMKSVTDRHPMTKLWADVETFRSVNPEPWFAEPMPIREVVQHMQRIKPYVDELITFSYDHYQSPKVVGVPYYHETYMQYVNTGRVDSEAPVVPSGLHVAAWGTDKIKLVWQPSSDNIGAMYYVYRDGVKIGKSYVPQYQDTGLIPNTTYRYRVEAADAAGNRSRLSDPVSIATSYQSTDWALGKSYVVSMPANSAYPDRESNKLTDGNAASNDPLDLAWQGRKAGKVPQTYTVTLDLEKTRPIDGVSLQFLTHGSIGAALPTKVEYWISDDDIQYRLLGQAPYRSANYGEPAVNRQVQFGLVFPQEQARYVKAVITIKPESWVFMDEFHVEQYKGAGIPVKEQLERVSLHKPYTVSHAAAAAYPDQGRVKLTDGKLGSIEFTDPAWQARADIAKYSVTLDLGRPVKLRRLDASFLRDEGAAINLPEYITVRTSTDGQHFTTRGTIQKVPAERKARKAYIFKLTSTVKAKYVQVDISTSSGWSFMDEMTVYR